MPELPEVETMCRGIQCIAGSRITRVVLLPCTRRPIRLAPHFPMLARRVAGQQILSVGRLGKRVVLELERGDRLMIEPRMTGLMLLADPPSHEHLRLRLDLASGRVPHVWYWDRRGLGVVQLLSARAFQSWLDRQPLGPDALTISSAELVQRLSPSRRPIKVALLDQRAIAGIGNLYAAEILHRAGVHPAQPCDQLAPRQWDALHAALRQVLREAIRLEGSTLSDGTYRNALSRSGRYQTRHRVYGRAGQRCPTCRKGEIVRMVQAQRSSFFCPVCQPLGRD
jgi:formamidopyrimidine-DNA glycosylase